MPEAKVGVAHGRLSETELERVMLDFVDNKINVLVCTTIVESGLDIPSANTMIINKAERLRPSRFISSGADRPGGQPGLCLSVYLR